MTGQELRDHLAARNITPNQFNERFADAKGGNRKSSTRTAKRYLEGKKLDEVLVIREPNRSIVAKVAGLDPAVFDGRTPRGSRTDRLEEVAERVAFLLTENARLSKDLKDARTRLGRLERARKHDLAAATQSGGS